MGMSNDEVATKDETQVANVGQDVADEIDAGVESAMKEIEAGRPADGSVKEEKTDDADPADGAVDDEVEVKVEKSVASTGGDAPATITDELAERAVKAGLSLAEARQYPTAELLGSMCDRLEAVGARGKADDGDDDTHADTAGVDTDPLAAFPDLDPEEYDEQLVAGFKAMKDLARQQQETINSLRGDRSQDWFNAQVEGLDQGVQAAIKDAPEKRAALRTKFDVLSAGYKAAGQDVDRTTVFQEATSLTLRDELAKSSDQAKAAALAKRGKQHIQRSAGQRSEAKGDVFSDVAEEVDQKFFK